MTHRKYTPTYTAEFRECGIRFFKEICGNHSSDNAAYKAIASKLGCSPDSLRAWCQQAECDAGMRDPELASDPAKSDMIDCEDIKRIYKASDQRYGARGL